MRKAIGASSWWGRNTIIAVLATGASTAVADEPKPRQWTTAEIQALPAPDLMWLVATHYNMPYCLLDAIWSKESSRLEAPWRDNRSDWVRAASAIKAGGACLTYFERNAHEKCKKHWRGLESLCAQRYTTGPRRGKRLCDPREVWSSPALAVGPMQQLPGELNRPCEDNPAERCWTKRVVDFDGDGVVNPFALPDAFAMTAERLVRYHAEAESWAAKMGRRVKGRGWREAAERYYGNPPRGYYTGEWKETSRGRRWSRGVGERWVECCKDTGLCPSH